MSLKEKYFAWVNSLLAKQIDATGMALFRMAYCIILICEISQIIYFRHLIYDKVPFLIPAEINVLPGLIVWMIAVIFVLFGFYTRQAALINYVLSLVFIGTIKSYEYHVFYTYMGVNFLFLFVDISSHHSIDRLRKKLKYSSAKFTFEPRKSIGVWHYYLLIAVGVGFVYFDSIFFKLASYNWMHGLGMWLPASLPMATHADVSLFLNIKWLAIGLGYLTIAFELIFLFTFYLRKFRIPLLVIGAGLHIGIIVIFPIPWFGLSVLAIYILMIPQRFWRWVGSKIKAKKFTLTVFYDQDCPLCHRTKIIFKHLDYFNKVEWCGVGSKEGQLLNISQNELYAAMHARTVKGEITKGVKTYLQILKRIPLLFPLYIIFSLPGVFQLAQWSYKKIAGSREIQHCTDDTCGYTPPMAPLVDHEIKILQSLTLSQLKGYGWGILLLMFIFLQVNVTSHSKLVDDTLEWSGVKGSKFQEVILSSSKKLWGVSKIFFGITRHGVFMDEHFKGYNHIVGVEAVLPDGRKEWLPIINEDGTASWFDYSFNWVKWTFRVVDNDVNQESLRQGIRDFSTFWAVSNDYDVLEIKFNIYVKPLRIPKEWEENFLIRQKLKKWKKVGVAYWEGDRFVADYPTIETITFDE